MRAAGVKAPVALQTLVRDWWQSAACREYGEEFFFIEDDERRESKKHAAVALAICASCPVLHDCRESLVTEAAVGYRDLYGVRAGMTAVEQRRYVQDRLRALRQ